MIDKSRKEDKNYSILESNEFFKLAESSSGNPSREPAFKENSGFKYKPDWICSDKSCKNLNFARRTHCNLCGLKRSDDVQLDYTSQFVPDRDLLNSKRNKSSLKPGEWYCPNCNILNFSCRTVCIRCNTDKPNLGERSDNNLSVRDKKVEGKDGNNTREVKDKKSNKRDNQNEGTRKKKRERSRERSSRESESRDSVFSSSGNSKSNDRSPHSKITYDQNPNQIINPLMNGSQPNHNLVENIINIATSLSNFARNTGQINNNVSIPQTSNQPQNVFCPGYTQGGSIPLHLLVQSFLGILSQKMEQQAFYEFSNAFINMINQYILSGKVSN